MVTILGANGAISSELVKELTTRNESIRLVSRNPKLVPGAAEAVAADLSNLDDTVKAVTGSRIAFLLVGLKYDITEWRALWPRMMRNAIEAAKRAEHKIGLLRQRVYVRESGRRDDGANALPPLQQKGRDPRADRHYASNRAKGGQPHGTHRALRRLLWPPSPARHPQCSGVRQVGQGRESELACQRFCEAFVHLHAGRRAESGATGGERKRLESNMARSYCSRSADRETVH